MKTFAIFFNGYYMDYAFASSATDAVEQWAASHTGGEVDFVEATLWR